MTFEHLKANTSFKVWQGGYDAKYICNNSLIKQKMECIYSMLLKDKIGTF
jgi:hypothetical protein